MLATRIIAIRHGETEWNALRRLQGHKDIHLNAQGLRQAKAMALALSVDGQDAIDAIFSSDLARALQTAQELAHATHAPLTSLAALRERSFGDWEGQSYEDLNTAFPEQALRWRRREPHWAPPGAAETLMEFRTRVSHVVDELGARHLDHQIALVSHGGVLDTLYRLATGLAIDAPRTWALGNATINRLLWTPDAGLTLVGWADSRHLENSLNLEIGDDAR